MIDRASFVSETKLVFCYEVVFFKEPDQSLFMCSIALLRGSLLVLWVWIIFVRFSNGNHCHLFP